MTWFHWVMFFVSLALQLALIASLRRGPYKEYPFVFVYSLVLLLTTVADGAVIAKLIPLKRASAQTYFYENDAIRQFLLFAVVVSLLERAMQASRFRAGIRYLFGLAAVVAVFLSLYIHSDASSRPPLWVSQVARDLSFGSAMLTLLLWTMLVSSRSKDRQLLLVTVGLGLQFTGEAIGHSMRQIPQYHQAMLLAGNFLSGIAHLMRLYLWREAFRQMRTREKIEPDEKPREAFSHQAETLFEANA